MAATLLGTDLQTRIFAILSADQTLQNLLEGPNRVLDHVPDKFTFPFVKIGEEDVNDWRSKTHRGFQGTATIRVITQSQNRAGQKKNKEIMSRIWTLLDNQDLAVPDRVQIAFYMRSQPAILPEPDNRTLQGIMQFDFIFGGNEDG